jgi:hypothetical protein
VWADGKREIVSHAANSPVNPGKEMIMPSRFDHLQVANGDLVLAKDMADALTTATLTFEDGNRQTFTADGKTTYVKHRGSTQGEWSIVRDEEFS